jgi:hypothetical protein
MYGGYHSRACLIGKPHLTCTDGCYSRQEELEAEWHERNDEPLEDVLAAFNRGEKHLTARPRREEDAKNDTTKDHHR